MYFLYSKVHTDQTQNIMPGKVISINQIVAIDENGGIGINGNIPWNLSKDWGHFLRLTTKVQVHIHLL